MLVDVMLIYYSREDLELVGLHVLANDLNSVFQAGKDCGFTQWLDDEFPEKATKHINSLLSSAECLEQEVENLQEEIDEFRHRYVISSNCAPCDTQGGRPRPRQVRRLVKRTR